LAKLTGDEIVTLHVLKEKGESNCAVAKRLGITEGAVRYHVRRAKDNAQDGRKKLCLIERLGRATVVANCNGVAAGRSTAERAVVVDALGC